MQIKVTGANIDIGQSLTQYVEENLAKAVTKYFENAINAVVHFSKNNHTFKVVITVNEGVKGGINVKSDAEAGDVYGCFNEATEKCVKQLRRYKGRIKNYRHQGGGLKSVEPNYKALDAMKYILPPTSYNIFEDMESDESDVLENNSLKVIDEKSTDIEELSVEEAIMKMDLQNLPALVFINNKNKRLNVVYHRKDGNISWIDPRV
jgi:ribosomal subunit interface protein